jgi:glycoside hydrolase-like protein
LLPRITTNSPLRNIHRKPSRLTFAVAAATVAICAAFTAGLAGAGPGAGSAASQAGVAAHAPAGHALGASAVHFTAGRAGRPGRAHAGAGQPGAANSARVPVAPRPRVVRRSAARKAGRHLRWHPVLGLDSMMGVGSSALTHTGVHFVARYIAPGNPKTLTRAELATLQRHGTRVVAIWELGATDMLGGYQAGRWAAQQAQHGLNGLGIPHAAVYFCADFDASAWQQGAINSYLRGAASVVGLHRTGLYGGYWVIKRAFDAHVIQYGWQTYAWSGGLWDPRAALRQYSVNQYRAGVPVDLNLAVHPNYGAIYPGR